MRACKKMSLALLISAFTLVCFFQIGYASPVKETWIFVSNEETGTKSYTQKEAAFYESGKASGIVRIENSSKEVYVLYRIDFQEREDGGYSATVADGSLYDSDGTLIEKDGKLTRQQSEVGSNLWKVCRTIQAISRSPKNQKK